MPNQSFLYLGDVASNPQLRARSFNHFELNCGVWLLVRTYCRGLLGSEELERYQELYEENNDDENRQSEWEDLLEKFDPDDIFIDAYKG